MGQKVNPVGLRLGIGLGMILKVKLRKEMQKNKDN